MIVGRRARAAPAGPRPDFDPRGRGPRRRSRRL